MAFLLLDFFSHILVSWVLCWKLSTVRCAEPRRDLVSLEAECTQRWQIPTCRGPGGSVWGGGEGRGGVLGERITDRGHGPRGLLGDVGFPTAHPLPLTTPHPHFPTQPQLSAFNWNLQKQGTESGTRRGKQSRCSRTLDEEPRHLFDEM